MRSCFKTNTNNLFLGAFWFHGASVIKKKKNPHKHRNKGQHFHIRIRGKETFHTWMKCVLLRYTHRIYTYKHAHKLQSCNQSSIAFEKDSGWIRIFHSNLKSISICPALCWNWVVIRFPIWEVEPDGQLAVEFARRAHNPTYITQHVCKICTAVLGRKMRCLEIKSAVQEWKIYPLSTWFLSASFICILGSHMPLSEHSALAAHGRPAERGSCLASANRWPWMQQHQSCLTPPSLWLRSSAGVLLMRWGKNTAFGSVNVALTIALQTRSTRSLITSM